MRNKYNLAELFSGIGSQCKALKNLGLEINTLATCEWDVHAVIAYDILHSKNISIPDEIASMKKKELLEKLKEFTFSNSGKEPLEYDSLKSYSENTLKHILASITRNRNRVDISTINGKDMPWNIDILTYSFPCQDLSNVGAFHGYNKGIDKNSGSRSSLLWQVGRILSEMRAAAISLPRFLLMENVPTLLSARHKKNFDVWLSDLENLGYVNQYYELNASSFGLPQNRPRLLMISVLTGTDSAEREFVKKYFEGKSAEDVINDYHRSDYYHQYTIAELLRTDYTNKDLYEEALECTPNDTESRRKIWQDNPQLILPDGKINPAYDTIRTITTKQDRNPNSGNIYFESGVDGRGTFRYLTPRECMLFMGFNDNDYEKLKQNNIEFHKGDALFARDKVIRMAGNSIPVKLLEGVFLQILQLDELLTEFHRHRKENLFGVEKLDEECNSIRSYMHRHGLRSRLGDKYYPENADIAYPKYKSAVYIYDCFSHGHSCKDLALSDNNNLYLEQLSHSMQEQDKAEQQKVIAKGWNVIILWTCELTPTQRDTTLAWLEKTVRNNFGNKTTVGEIMTYGG